MSEGMAARRSRLSAWAVAVLSSVCVLCASACGGTETHSSRDALDTTPPLGSAPTPRAIDAIELDLTRTDGSPLSVGSLRGQCTLLFLFATFDGASQASLRPLRAFVRAHPEVHVVAVAVEDDPSVLADAWEHALSPPFPVTYDSTGAVLEGTSSLGRIGSVPRFRLLDAAGHSAAESVGYPVPGTLDALLASGCANSAR